MKQFIISSLLILLITSFLVVSPELAFRFYYRLTHGEWPVSFSKALKQADSEASSLFIWHSILPFVLRPSSQAVFMDTCAKINASGLRGNELRTESSLRIIALGGSTTFDTGVDDDSTTWTNQLERELSEFFPGVEVINAGLPVYSIWGNTVKYLLYDHLTRPDIVLIYQGINDLNLWWARDLEDVIRVDYWNYKGLGARHWSGVNDRVVNRSGPPLADLLRNSVFLFGTFNKRGFNPNVFKNMIHAKGLEAMVGPEILKKSTAMLGFLTSIVENSGALPVFIPQSVGRTDRKKPLGVGLDPLLYSKALTMLNTSYIENCKKNLIKIIELTEEMEKWGDDMFRDWVHFNNKGAREFAHQLAQVLIKDPDVARIYKQNQNIERRLPTHILQPTF